MTYSTPLLASFAFAIAAAGCGVIVTGGPGEGTGGGTGTGMTVTTTTVTTSSGSTTTTTTTTTSTSSGTGGSGAHAEPPPPGPASPGDGSGATVFAVSHLYVGDTDRDGTPDMVNGWKQYGFDLDGKISTAQSVDVCKPQGNASPHNVYPDGYAGIDNSFGKNILPLLFGLTSDFSHDVNASIEIGHGTMLIALDQLGTAADYDPLVARQYQSGDLGQIPSWSGSDHWPIAPESLLSPSDPSSAKVSTTQSYLIGNTWVGAFQGDVILKLPVVGFELDLAIHHPVLSMELDGAHTSATMGTLSGVISTESFVQAFKQVAGNFDPSLCGGPTIDAIALQIRQASDILSDGSQDPNKMCDGISIGIGFDAVVAELGAVGPATPPPPNPCGP